MVQTSTKANQRQQMQMQKQKQEHSKDLKKDDSSFQRSSPNFILFPKDS